MTGPIIFSHEVPRRELRENGSVVTFRTSERTTGDTWWRESRTGPKQGDVSVHKLTRGQFDGNIHEVDPEFVFHSGFESADEWARAIEEFHGDYPVPGYLYVTIVRGDSR